MDSILENLKDGNNNEKKSVNITVLDNDSESLCNYDENKNDLFQDVFFNETLGDSSEIIEHQIDDILKKKNDK